MKNVTNSDTDRLIEQAFEHDRSRFPAPPDSPPADLLKKFSSVSHTVAPHAWGIFGSVGTPWMIGAALVFVAAVGITYFSLREKPTASSHINPPAPHVQAIIPETSSITRSGTVPSSHSAPIHSEHRYAPMAMPKPAVSEDSILREEIAHPTVIPAPDTARTTIHR